MTLSLSIVAPNASLAQGSPIPGVTSAPAGVRGDNNQERPFTSVRGNSAPLPGSGLSQTDGQPPGVKPGASPPGLASQLPASGRKAESIYRELPLSLEAARIKIEDLSNRLLVDRADEVKDSIYALSEWLQDVADAHWRMHKAFEKSDMTKPQANKEKDIALRFSALKNRAKLLKADLLIKQNRYPEALGPLVEIVTAEPTTTNGQDAYKRLVDMGFSESVVSPELAGMSGQQKH